MKIYKLQNKENKKKFFFVKKLGKYYKIKSDIYSNSSFDVSKKPIDKTLFKLVPPISPKKIICLAINYKGISGFDKNFREPLVFLKTNNTITIKKKIKIPFKNFKAWGEPEIGVIIKKKLNNRKYLKNSEDILGYCIANDISCYNISNRDHHLARAKSADNFCPISNFIDTEFEIKNKKIQSYHNENLLRLGNTNEMIWDIKKIITWLSSWMTLDKGDLILTGSPPRVRKRIFLKQNDVFRIEIEGLGSIHNEVV